MNLQFIKKPTKKSAKASRHVLDEMQYFDKHYIEYVSKSKRDLIWQVPEEIIFSKYLYKNKNWVMLDLGCGPAINIKRNILPKMSTEDVYIGVDVSKKLLKTAKRNVPIGRFIQSPMSSFKIKRKADYLCFFGALHHDEKPEKTLKRAISFLKSGGFVFLREPQEKVMKKGHGVSPHEGGLSPVKLKNWLKESDLDIIEWHFLNTVPFHLMRRVLIKLRLRRWEKVVLFWKIKVLIELMMEKFFMGPLRFLEGTDMFIVARKGA